MIKSKLLIFIILFFIIISYMSNAQSQEYVYSLKIKYSNGEISKEELKMIEGNAPDRLNQPEEGYLLKVISFDEKILYSFKFEFSLTPLYEPPDEWFDDEGNQIFFPDETTEEVIEETNLILIIPYYRTAERIEIYNSEDELVLSVYVFEYSTCNLNNMCEPNENIKNCPEDCENIEISTEDETTPISSGSNKNLIIGILISLIVIHLIVSTILHKKHFAKKKEKELK